MVLTWPPPIRLTNIPLSVAATTSCGFAEPEVESLSHWMCDVIENMEDETTLMGIREKVRVLCNSFPVYSALDDDDATMRVTALAE